ncbi:hypothetical protein B9Z55_003438 [Caenorhabditis nigoni]|uniref:Uncharacterized protein n=1 Tax=Caenorhabditis nigoni TaxID=1611254 RepID=A0A2G5VQZ9_9PELO|nr:hypothetical protein B9Z55_003438 [Caenorhabditis nigoni]
MHEKKSQGVISGWISWKGKEMVEIFDHKHKYLYGEIDDPFVSYGAWVEYNVVPAPSDHPKNCYKMAVNIDEDVRISEAPTNDEFSKNPMNVREFNKVNFFQYQNEGKQLTYKNSISRDFRNNDAYKNDYYGEVILSRDARNRLIQYNINTLDVMLNLIQSERYSGSGPHWEVTHFIHQGKMYSINGFLFFQILFRFFPLFLSEIRWDSALKTPKTTPNPPFFQLSIRGFVLRGPGGVVRDRRDVYIPPDALRPISYNGAPQPRRSRQVQSTSSDWDTPAPQNPQNPAPPRGLQSFGTSSGFGGDSGAQAPAQETPQAPNQRGFGFRAPSQEPRDSENVRRASGASTERESAFGRPAEPARSGFGGSGAFGRGGAGIPDDSSDFEIPQRQQITSGAARPQFGASERSAAFGATSGAPRQGSEASRPATQGFGRSGPSFGASEPILAGLGAPGFQQPEVPQRVSNPFRAPSQEPTARSNFGDSEDVRPRESQERRPSGAFGAPEASRRATQGFGRSGPSFGAPELSLGASEPILAGLGAPRAERAGLGFNEPVQEVQPAPISQIQRGFGFRAPNSGETPPGPRERSEGSRGFGAFGRSGAFGREGAGIPDDSSDFEIPQRQQIPTGGSQAARPEFRASEAARQGSEAFRPATQGFGRPSFGASELSNGASEPILAGLGAPRAPEPVRSGFEGSRGSIGRAGERSEGSRQGFGASEAARPGFGASEPVRSGLGRSGQGSEGSRTVGRGFGGFGGATGPSEAARPRFGDSEANGARNVDPGASRSGFGASGQGSEGSRTVGRSFGGFGGGGERSEGSRPVGGTIGRSFGFGGVTTEAARPRIGGSDDADYIFGSPSPTRGTSGAEIGASGATRPSFGGSEPAKTGFGLAGERSEASRPGFGAPEQRSEGSRTIGQSFGTPEPVRPGFGGSIGAAGERSEGARPGFGGSGVAGERSEGSRPTSFGAPELARFGFGRSIGAARPSFEASEPARTGFEGSGAFGRVSAAGIPDDSSDFEIPQRQQITPGGLQTSGTARPEFRASDDPGAARQASEASRPATPTSRSREIAASDYIFGSPSPQKTERSIQAPGARSEAPDPARGSFGRSITSEASRPGFGASEPVRSGFGGAGERSEASRPGFGATQPAMGTEPRRLSFGAPRSFGVSDPSNPVAYEQYVPIGNSTFDSDSVDLDISCVEESEPKDSGADNGASRVSEAARPGFGASAAPRDPVGARNGTSEAARPGIGASETARQGSEGSRPIPRSFGGPSSTEAAARPRIGGSNDADYIFGSPSPTKGTSGAGIGASGGLGAARTSFGAPEPVRTSFGGSTGGAGQRSEGSRTSFGASEPVRTSFGGSIGRAGQGSEGSPTIRTSFGAPQATGAQPLSSFPAFSSPTSTVTRNPEATTIQPAYQIQDGDDWSGSSTELAPMTPAELNNNTKKPTEQLFNEDTDDDDWGSDSGAPPVRFMPPQRRAGSFGLPPAAKQGLSKFNSKF